MGLFRLQKYSFFTDYARKTHFFCKFSIFNFQFSIFLRTFAPAFTKKAHRVMVN